MGPSLLLLAVVLADQSTSRASGADDYIGRWNVLIAEADDTFRSGGFQIERKGDGLAGALVWRWGSFAPVKSVEWHERALRIVREEKPGQADVFEARLDGETLAGQVTYADGKVHHFRGRRAPELPSAAPPAWAKPVALFDGKSLAGWKLRDPKARLGWAVVGGELAVVEPKGNADLVSEHDFQDFKLHLEFNVEPRSNSGVYLRGRYELQILDNPDAKTALDSHGCGAVYSRIAPRLDATRPAGEWNALDVTVIGRSINVILNGKEIVGGTLEGITGGALDPFEDRPGPLMLQGDHGRVRFRNISVSAAASRRSR